MKRLAAAIGALALLGPFVATAGVADATTTPPYSPRDREMAFNIPRGKGHGTYAQQNAIIYQLNRAINAAPRGSDVRMAMYLFNVKSTADAVIAAHRRGVNMKLLIDDGERRSDITRVRRVLGTNRSARSYVATCSHSCHSRKTSTMHAKFYLFSTSGKSRNVALISSANPYRGNSLISWNNQHTLVNNRPIYGALYNYFNDMLKDRTTADYRPHTVVSGRYSLFLFPQGHQTKTEWLSALNGVSCTGMARGYGIRGRTRIRVAQWGWTTGRSDLANKLRELHARGCNVEVILNKGRTNKAVFEALLKNTSRGKLKVYDAWWDGNQNGIAGLYNHHKVMTIDGKWRGRSTRVVYTGSQNFSVQATTVNDDLIYRMYGGYSEHKTYMVYLNLMRDRSARRVYSVPDNPKIQEERGRVAPGQDPQPVSPEDQGYLKENAEDEEFAE